MNDASKSAANQPTRTDRTGDSKELGELLADGLIDLAICCLSPSGDIKAWNKGAQRLTGYTSDEVVGKHCSVLYTQVDRDRKYPTYELEESERTGRFERSGWWVKKDGSQVWIDVIICPFQDKDSKLQGFVVIARDALQRKEAEEIVERQKQDLFELSTPVMHLWKGILALPIIGTVDSSRSQIVMERLLQGIVASGCNVAILDISGVPTVDTVVAQHLMKTVDAARLMGAECIISGVRPEIALTMVHIGVDLSMIKTKSSMSRALEEALNMVDMKVVRNGHAKEDSHS